MICLNTSDDIKIKGVSKHFTARAIGTHDWANPNNSKETMKRLNHLHVPTDYINECIKSGNIFKTVDVSRTFETKKANVTVNKDTGLLVQCNIRRRRNK